jgi:hypothetical protein
MQTPGLRRTTGFSGVAVFLLALVVMPLYFVHDGPPPVSNVLTRVLVNMGSCLALVVFFVGFRQLLREANPSCEWLATLSLSFGLVFVTLTCVADSLQVAAVLVTRGESDPTMVGGRGEGSLLIFGPMARLFTAAFLLTAASAIAGTRILPRWTATMARAVAVFHLAMVPSLCSGTLPTHFYSLNGWNIPVAGGLLALWLVASSLTLLTQKA